MLVVGRDQRNKIRQWHEVQQADHRSCGPPSTAGPFRSALVARVGRSCRAGGRPRTVRQTTLDAKRPLVRAGDSAARLGGDECAVVLRDCDELAARTVAQKVLSPTKCAGNRQAVSRPRATYRIRHECRRRACRRHSAIRRRPLAGRRSRYVSDEPTQSRRTGIVGRLRRRRTGSRE